MDGLNDVVATFWALFQIFWPIWILAFLVFLVKLVLSLRKKARLAKSGIAELDKLNGEDFERYLEILFRNLGYKVTRTPYRGDYGADLVLQKDRIQTVVQAKRYNRSVGVKAVQEAVAAKEYYKCNNAMVITNSHFSKPAKKLAAANQVELWDRNQLVNRLLAMKQAPEQVATPVDGQAVPQVATPATPQPQTTIAACTTCGKAVSAKVVDYCLTHSTRFSGQVYCYEHQRSIR